MPEFKKILVANRGEIAIRVMRAANELGKKTVAVYAEEDKLSPAPLQGGRGLPDRRGDVARVGPICRSPRSSASPECGADAIHPGYGLLSENPISSMPAIRRASPSSARKAETMRALGDKASARRVAIEAGVPVIPATEVLGDDMDLVKKQAPKSAIR
jgi:pyruvate carboxylase